MSPPEPQLRFLTQAENLLDITVATAGPAVEVHLPRSKVDSIVLIHIRRRADDQIRETNPDVHPSIGRNPLDSRDDFASFIFDRGGAYELPLQDPVTAHANTQLSDGTMERDCPEPNRHVISRAQEFVLARGIQIERQRMRLALLSFDCVLQHVFLQLKRIQRREIRLDRYLNISVSDIEAKNRVKCHLVSMLDRIKLTRERNQQAFRSVIDRRLPLNQRREVWHDIVRRKHQMAFLIERLSVRDSKLRELVPLLDCSHSRLAPILPGGPHRTTENRARERARLEMLIQADSPATFRRRLAIFNRHRKEYVRLSKLLASSHIRFVLQVARQYQGSGFGLADLVQEGNVGLLRAIERFDPQRGFRLITYAEWWIRQEIHNALLRTLGPVAIPRSLSLAMKHFNSVAQSLHHVLGREPKREEIARCSGLATEQVRHIVSLSSRHLSLDQAISPGEDFSLVDLIEDRDHLREKRIESVRSQLQHALQQLSPRERDIINMRFGLNDGRPKTLAQIAKEYSLSRERIRQIEQDAVAKLQRDDIRRNLDDSFDSPPSQFGILRASNWRE